MGGVYMPPFRSNRESSWYCTSAVTVLGRLVALTAAAPAVPALTEEAMAAEAPATYARVAPAFKIGLSFQAAEAESVKFLIIFTAAAAEWAAGRLAAPGRTVKAA
jgi:hypothetical protein